MKHLICTTLFLSAAFAPAAVSADTAATLYAKQAGWPETMLETRARYLDWQQQDRRETAYEIGPWYATRPLNAPSFDAALFPERGVDVAVTDPKGRSLWEKRAAYRDGQVHNLPGRNQAATYLARTITARAAATVNASFGSDDGLKVWLNGKEVLSVDVPRGVAPNQNQAQLALQPGENTLLLKIYNRTGGHGFYFQMRDDPLPALWKRIAADFPREAAWFQEDAPGGNALAWFSEKAAPHFEKKLAGNALKRAGSENPLADRFAALREANPPRTDPQWLALHARARLFVQGAHQLDRVNLAALERAVTDLEQTFPEYAEKASGFREDIAKAKEDMAALKTRLAGGDESALEEVAALLERLRAPLLANPLLDFDEVLLVKRGAGRLGLPQNWQGNCAIPTRGYDNEIARMHLATRNLETVYRPEKGAFVGDVDLHFDADRMLFSMPGSHHRWQIWEVRPDGSGLRQVTPGAYADVDNYDACYLPDGRIIFDSTRAFQGIPCVGGGNTVANLCLLDPADNSIRQLCFDQDHNWCPTVMNSGRVMYTRWEYSDTPHYFSRLVFSMNPDGTNQMEYYGSNSFWPNSVFYARPIPGHPTRFAAIVSGHHGVPRMGELVLFDTGHGRFEGDGVVQRIPGYGKPVEPIIKDQLVNDSWPRFLHPYPLSGKYFLVSCQPEPGAEWGLYLVDIFDNMTLLKELPGYALFEPIPLRKTETPPVIPDKVEPDTDKATVYLTDIYAGRGLEGVPRGTVKALRLYEFHYAYPKMGGHIHIAVEGTWDVHRILGTVPVHEDGSALFEVPANTPIAVQPLDENGQALQLMRSWFTAMPGEVLSCVGCHEQQNESAPTRASLAARRAPSHIEEWLGPARGFSFKRDVQPVLNKYCVGCHNGEKKGRPDFRAKEKNGWNNFTPAYLELHPYVRRPGPESDYHIMNPTEYFADTSELVQMLKKGHHGVQLDDEAWQRLYAWIDLNVPDHGTWGEHRPIPQDFHARRLAMRTRYANRPEDPEVIPEMPPVDDTFLPPTPPEPAPTDTPACADWPFSADAAREMQAAAGAQTRRTLDLGEGVTLEMALIPAGEFVLGDANGYPDEHPLAKVRIEEPFWMSVTEITNAQYARFDPRHHNGYIDQHHKDHTLPGYDADRPEQPVIRISWHEAAAFCDWLGGVAGCAATLPTEAQWEWACRAGAGTALAYGGLDADFAAHANLADASMSKLAVHGVNPQPIKNPNEYQDFLPKDARFDDGQKIMCDVAQYAPNAWGLHDMHGNVAEWTYTAFRPYPYADDGRNAASAEGKRVVRGGSWRDRPKHARAGFRLAYQPWRKVYNVGFRVICPVSQDTPGPVALRGEGAN